MAKQVAAIKCVRVWQVWSMYVFDQWYKMLTSPTSEQYCATKNFWDSAVPLHFTARNFVKNMASCCKPMLPWDLAMLSRPRGWGIRLLWNSWWRRMLTLHALSSTATELQKVIFSTHHFIIHIIDSSGRWEWCVCRAELFEAEDFFSLPPVQQAAKAHKATGAQATGEDRAKPMEDRTEERHENPA